MILDKESKIKIFRSTKNIPNLKLIDQIGTNAYDVLKYKNVIFTTSSIKSFEKRISK
jgi:ribosomal protein L4